MRSTPRFPGGVIAAILMAGVVSILTASSCRQLTPPTGPDSTGHWADSGTTPLAISGTPQSVGILGMKVLTEAGQAGDFELDLFITDSAGHPVLNIPPSDFTIPPSFDTSFLALGCSALTSAVQGKFSAELLLDQTNSMATNDPEDLRLKAAKLFCDGITLLGGGNEVQVSSFFAFDSGGLNSYGPFTTTPSVFNSAIDGLAGHLGPWTPLYDAMYAETDSLSENGHNANKALIVFTDGEDNYSTHSLNQTIAYAASQNVKVFAIALKTGINLPLIAAAMSTGGSIMHTGQPAQLTSYFAGLGQQIQGGANYYQTKWHVTLPYNQPVQHQVVTGSVRILTPSGQALEAPFAVAF